MRDFVKILFLILKILFAGAVIALGMNWLVSSVPYIPTVMKEPYRLEDADLNQVKIGDHVTLDVTICLGVGSENYVQNRNTATDEINWRLPLDRSYLIPFMSTDGDDVNIDRILPVHVNSVDFEAFDNATGAFIDWLDLSEQDIYEIFSEGNMNSYINRTKSLDMNKLSQTVVYHYDGILQELPDEILYADADALRNYGLIEHLQRMYLVPAPKKDSVLRGTILGVVFILLGISFGFVVCKNFARKKR